MGLFDLILITMQGTIFAVIILTVMFVTLAAIIAPIWYVLSLIEDRFKK